MSARLSVGSFVQTPFGKGTVREIRNNGRILAEVKGRALIFSESEVSPLDDRNIGTRPGRARFRAPAAASIHEPGARTPAAPVEIDLHGLTVDQALAAAERALDRALRGDAEELRFIHGKSGGRIRGALHRWLSGIRSVRSFRVDPRNEGVTIVHL